MSEDLAEILSTFSVVDLLYIEAYIMGSPEYVKLYQHTQMLHEVVRTGENDRSNRGSHSKDVVDNARDIAETGLGIRDDGLNNEFNLDRTKQKIS